MKPWALALALLWLVATGAMVPQVEAGRLDDDDEAGSTDQGGNQTTNQTTNQTQDGNQTVNQTDDDERLDGAVDSGLASDVTVFVTDGLIFGFDQESSVKKRLANEFYIHVIPTNGTVNYKVIIDGFEQTLGNGETERTVGEYTKEFIQYPTTSRINIHVEIETRSGTDTLEFNNIRLVTTQEAVKGVDDEETAIEEAFKRQVRVFTDFEFNVYTIKWGVGALGAVLLGYLSARAKSDREVENMDVYPIAN